MQMHDANIESIIHFKSVCILTSCVYASLQKKTNEVCVCVFVCMCGCSDRQEELELNKFYGYCIVYNELPVVLLH